MGISFGRRQLAGLTARTTAVSRADFAAQAKFYRRLLIVVLSVLMVALFVPLGYPWWCFLLPLICLTYDRQHKTTVLGRPPAGEMVGDALVGSALVAVHPAFLVPELLIMLTLTAIAAIGYGPRHGWVYAAPTVVMGPIAAAFSRPPYAVIAYVAFTVCTTFLVVVIAAIVTWDETAQQKLAQFAEVVERLPLAVVIAQWSRGDGEPGGLCILSANAAAEALAGNVASGSLVGAYVETAFQTVCDHQALLEIHRGLSAGEQVELDEIVEPNPAGLEATRSFAVRAAPLEFDMVTVSFEDVTSEVALRNNLRHAAAHDPLTGLANRAHFDAQLQAALTGVAGQSDSEVIVQILDLNGFKEINDSLGHHLGDQVLVAISQRIDAALGNRGLLARLGGDEFAVLLTDFWAAQARDVADELRSCVMAPIVIDGRSLSVGVSVGAARYPSDARSAEALIRHADAAMYREKHGRVTAVRRLPSDGKSPTRSV